MPSRRSLLIGAVRTALGGTILGGIVLGSSSCSTGSDASVAPTDGASPPSSSTTQEPTPPEPATSTPIAHAPTTITPTTTGATTAPPATSVTSTPTTDSTDDPTTDNDAPTVGPAWASADFDELDAFISSTNGTGFAVVEAGTLVHEWYRDETSARRDIASAQKSVLSLLVGRAVVDGHFATDTKVDDLIGNGWTTHGETAGITVRNLLTMTSGLDDELDVVAAPDAVWLYSGAFAVLFDVLVEATGRELDDLATDWLFGPAGAGTAAFYERRTNQFAPTGMVASISDLTSIGTWIVDQTDQQRDQPYAAWLRASFEADQDLNDSYGSLWWLNGKESFVLPGPSGRSQPGPLIPSAPADMVAALGKDDQKLYVSRDLSLVVVRVGDRAVPEARQALSSFDDQLWSMLTRLRG